MLETLSSKLGVSLEDLRTMQTLIWEYLAAERDLAASDKIAMKIIRLSNKLNLGDVYFDLYDKPAFFPENNQMVILPD